MTFSLLPLSGRFTWAQKVRLPLPLRSKHRGKVVRTGHMLRDTVVVQFVLIIYCCCFFLLGWFYVLPNIWLDFEEGSRDFV